MRVAIRYTRSQSPRASALESEDTAGAHAAKLGRFTSRLALAQLAHVRGSRPGRTGPVRELIIGPRSSCNAMPKAITVKSPGSRTRPSSIAWIVDPLTPDRAASSAREIFSTLTRWSFSARRNAALRSTWAK